MNLFRLSIANLGMSPLSTAVNILLLSLGTASIAILLIATYQLTTTLTRDSADIDLVIGAKGSPLQLVLAGVYHADVPPGNIPLKDAKPWMEHSQVESATPLALGDSFRGFRIVGTEHEYLDTYGGTVATGRLWEKPLEIVVGAAVAEETGLKVGSTFAGTHGLADDGHAHDEDQYTVVGVLAETGSVLDRLLVTAMESVWILHDSDHHDHGDHSESAEHDSHDDHDHEAHKEGEHDHHDHDEHDHDAHKEGEHDHHDHDEHDHDAHKEGKHDHHDHDEHDHDAHKEGEHDHHDHDEHDHDAHKEGEHDHHDHDEHDHDAHKEGEHDHHDHDEHDHDTHKEAEHDHHDHDHDAHKESEHDHHDHDEHDHSAHNNEDKEATVVLLKYATPLAALNLPREINESSALQAASPAFEITRLLQIVGIGIGWLQAFAAILLASAALSIFAALYASLKARRHDLAVLRCLGATRFELFTLLFVEGMVLTLAGITVGLVAAHGGLELIGMWLGDGQIALTGLVWAPTEFGLIAGLITAGVLTAILPAWQAFSTDVAQTLSRP